VFRVDGPDELDLDALGDARVVGVTAGASAPEDLVEQVIEHLAPAEGVELVNVTDEDEYFPPPRELRELLPRLVALATGLFGGGSEPAPKTLPDDRSVDASTVLADLSP
jgi:4-hydroxy-3-methylbut-2-enyl diphosphate reductase